MFDAACLGTVNMDIVAFIEEFPENDSEVVIKELMYIPSGSAANVAAGLCRLGHKAAILGAVGNDTFAEQIRSRLHEEGIDTTGLVNLDGTSGTIFIPVNRKGERQIYNSSEAPSKFSKECVNKDIINKSKFFYMCGIVGDNTLDTLAEASSYAKRLRKTVVFDPTIFAYLGREKISQLIENTDILLINKVEAKHLFGSDSPENLSVVCPAIILKLGPEGCVVLTKEGKTKIDGFNVSAVDTTGAGDSFAAALMSRLLKGDSITDAARYASKVAAISVTKKGAMATPTSEEIKKFKF